MTTVWGDHEETFAVDWDWRRGLTVWTLGGRRSEPKYERKLLERELESRPASERAAQAEARRWWRREGRAEALAAAADTTTR